MGGYGIVPNPGHHAMVTERPDARAGDGVNLHSGDGMIAASSSLHPNDRQFGVFQHLAQGFERCFMCRR